MTRTVSFASGVLLLVLLSGLTAALPVASAQTTVTVTIPVGAGNPSGAPGYAPDTITVVIGVNNTVMWVNKDTVAHTVTPVTQPTGSTWGTGSGNLPAGQSYTFTFTVAGTYDYDCVYHSWMTGTVIVKAATPVPEFPVASLAVILFAVIAVVVVAAPRLRPRLPTSA